MNEAASLTPDTLTHELAPQRLLPKGLLLVMDSAYPTTGGGGAESQAGTLGRWFNANDCPSTLVVPMLPGDSSVARERIDGLPVERIAYPHIKLLGALVLQIRLFLLIWQRRHRISGIYAHIGGWMAVVCCVAGRLAGLPVLVKMTGDTELNGGALDRSAGLGGRVKRAGLQWATAYQATSSHIARAIAAVGLSASKTHRIANAVQLDRFDAPATTERSAALREMICPNARFVALFVGRLEPVKGVDVLLNAWAQGLAGDADAWLVLVGAGSEHDALVAQAQRLGIASQVVFAGRIDAIQDYMHMADVAVLPSWREGLSNAMLESMAAGLPTLGSRISGNEDFIEEGATGWLFEAGDTDGLATRLAQVRAAGPQQWQRLGAQARAEIEARASLGAVTAQLLQVFEDSVNADDTVSTKGKRCAASRG